jgi:hypothetical protein
MEYWQRLRQAVGQDTLILSGAAGAIVKDGKILLARQLLFFFKMEGELTPLNLQDSEITACDFFAFDAIPEDTMDCCKQKVLDLLEYRGQTLFR